MAWWPRAGVEVHEAGKAQVPMERGLGVRTPGRAPGHQDGQPAPGCGDPPPGGLASGVSGRLSRGLRRRAAAGARSKEGAAPHLQAEVRELGALAI